MNDALPSFPTECQLVFHGAAANSCPHSLQWISCPFSTREKSTSSDNVRGSPLVDTVLYASSGVINLATPCSTTDCNEGLHLMSVTQTLVTNTCENSSSDAMDTQSKKVLARGEAVEDAAALRSVTALCWLPPHEHIVKNSTANCTPESHCFGIFAAFSDGTLTSWRWTRNNINQSNVNSQDDISNGYHWKEHILIGNSPDLKAPIIHSFQNRRHPSNTSDNLNLKESISDISVISLDDNTSLVGTASSSGINLCLSYLPSSLEVTDINNNTSCNNETIEKQAKVFLRRINDHATASVCFERHYNQNLNCVNECFLFAGSASPHHNKVLVYTIPYSFQSSNNGSSATTDLSSAATFSSWEVLPFLAVGDPIYHGCLIGHQDWITCFAWIDLTQQCSDSCTDNTRVYGETLLASSGHDAKIRLWKFTSVTISSTKIPSDEVQTAGNDEDILKVVEEEEDNIDNLEEAEGEARLVIHHSHFLGNCKTNVSLEALLIGHEEAVTSLNWKKKKESSEKSCLLSASMDRTILLWMEEEFPTDDEHSTGLWVPVSRIGSAGGILGGSIGASLMGFVDACFSPTASRIVGHGYGGSLHFWTQLEEIENPAVETDAVDETREKHDALICTRWIADPCITGHFQSVEDLAWDPYGEYFLTVGSDQTTRLWAEVFIGAQSPWMEVGRPQVHGYDLTSIVCVGGQESVGEPRHRFVSGADEKVLRVFDAPVSTLRLLSSLKKLREPTISDISHLNEDVTASWRVERAFMPSLGLSNKATADKEQGNSKYSGPTDDNDDYLAGLNTVQRSRLNLLTLPSERDLGVTTLWPETGKLFGHDSEIVCLDAYLKTTEANEPTLVASSCKARNDVAGAAIRLWNVELGKCVGILKGGHRSTVSALSFSKDGKYLVSSGKDRRICVWRRDDSQTISDEKTVFQLSAAVDSAHKRIIWSIHFCPTDSNILASGSRDGLVKVWRVFKTVDGSHDLKELSRFEPASKQEKKSEPVTAVAFSEGFLSKGGNEIHHSILAIATESGRIEVWATPIFADQPNTDSGAYHSPILLHVITANDSHFASVKKISWRPLPEGQMSLESNKSTVLELMLASCGEDCGVRLFKMTIKNTLTF